MRSFFFRFSNTCGKKIILSLISTCMRKKMCQLLARNNPTALRVLAEPLRKSLAESHSVQLALLLLRDSIILLLRPHMR